MLGKDAHRAHHAGHQEPARDGEQYRQHPVCNCERNNDVTPFGREMTCVEYSINYTGYAPGVGQYPHGAGTIRTYIETEARERFAAGTLWPDDRADGMLFGIGGRDDGALGVGHDRLCRMQTFVDRLHAGDRIEYLPIVFTQN